MQVLFRPQIECLAHITPTASVSDIESEPMLFSASPDFARQAGGKLTELCMDAIESHLRPNKNYVIDTKSVMLMPGMYPSIPGWHCDGVIRAKDGDQPDPDKIDRDVKHFVVMISSNKDGVSNTKILCEEVEIDVDKDRVWGSLNDQLEKKNIMSTCIPDGAVVQFTQDTPHRAEAAHAKGWRFFFRCSEYHMPPMNKIRHQVQVYTRPENGW